MDNWSLGLVVASGSIWEYVLFVLYRFPKDAMNSFFIGGWNFFSNQRYSWDTPDS